MTSDSNTLCTGTVYDVHCITLDLLYLKVMEMGSLRLSKGPLYNSFHLLDSVN